DERRRIQNVIDARMDLEEIDSPRIEERTTTPKRARGSFLIGAVIAGLLILSAIGVWRIPLVNRGESQVAAVRFNIEPPEGYSFAALPGIAVSPDGRYVTFEAIRDGQRTLWIRPLDSLKSRQLPGTEGASGPFW